MEEEKELGVGGGHSKHQSLAFHWLRCYQEREDSFLPEGLWCHYRVRELPLLGSQLY